jgi:hypothetical protein
MICQDLFLLRGNKNGASSGNLEGKCKARGKIIKTLGVGKRNVEGNKEGSYNFTSM